MLFFPLLMPSSSLGSASPFALIITRPDYQQQQTFWCFYAQFLFILRIQRAHWGLSQCNTFPSNSHVDQHLYPRVWELLKEYHKETKGQKGRPLIRKNSFSVFKHWIHVYPPLSPTATSKASIANNSHTLLTTGTWSTPNMAYRFSKIIINREYKSIFLSFFPFNMKTLLCCDPFISSPSPSPSPPAKAEPSLALTSFPRILDHLMYLICSRLSDGRREQRKLANELKRGSRAGRECRMECEWGIKTESISLKVKKNNNKPLIWIYSQ